MDRGLGVLLAGRLKPGMGRLAHVFKIRPGEGKLVALLIGMMMAFSAGNGMGGASIDALLFARFGVEFLPYLYIVLGLVTFLNLMAVAGLLGRVPRERLYLFLPLALAGVVLLSRLLVALDIRWFYPVLFIAKEVMISLQAVVIWGLASAVFDARQARRLFPLLIAGSIAGSTIGSLLTPLLAGGLGADNILVVWAGCMALGFLQIRLLLREGQARARAVEPAPSQKERRRKQANEASFLTGIRNGYQFVQQSSLLRWFAVASVLFSLLWFSLLLPFSRAAAEHYPDANRLAGFLGLFSGLQNAAGLLVSLLLANRLFARFGLINMLLALPAIYLAGFSLLLVLGTFPVIVVFRFIKLIWSQSLAETAYQVSFNAIPDERRDQARAFINAVPGQAGIVLSGIILVIGERALPPQQLVWIGLVSAILCMFAVWKVKRAYQLALVEALRSGQPHVFSTEEEPFGGFQRDATVLPVILSGLEDPHPGVRRLSAEVLEQLAEPQAAGALLKAVHDPDFEVRVAALRALAATDDATAMREALACLDDPQPEVRCQAIETLSQGNASGDEVISRIRLLGDDPQPAVRGNAAIALKRAGDVASALDILKRMASDLQPEIRARAMYALGGCWAAGSSENEPANESFLERIAAGLGDPNAAVRRAASGALTVPPPELIEPLLRNLSDEDQLSRQAAAAALGRAGEPALQAVLAALNKPDREGGALAALEYFSEKLPLEGLRQYASQNVAQANHYRRLASSFGASGDLPVAGAMPEGAPVAGERAKLFSESLLAKARERALYALSAVSLFTDRRSVTLSIENLQSQDRSQRAYALEALEALGEPQLIRPLIQIWESGGGESPAPKGLWTEALQDPDDWLRACAAFYAGECREVQLIPLLEQLAQSDPNELVRSTARWALKGEYPVDTLQTISTMERVLFLRRVKLFAKLTPVDLKQIAAVAKERLFLDGETIVQQGEPGDEMYIIVSGEVSVLNIGGTELARRKPGDFVGEMAIISQQPRMATLVAVGDVRTLCIGQKQFEGILRERFEISMAVMQELGERLRQSSSPVPEAALDSR